MSKGAVERNLLHELEIRRQIEPMSDRELISALIKEVWSSVPLYTRAGVLIDEAIERLRRTDIQRRWDKRRER